MSSIDKKEYRKTAEKLASKKYASLKEEQLPARKKKTMDYLVAKGYEWELARDVVEKR